MEHKVDREEIIQGNDNDIHIARKLYINSSEEVGRIVRCDDLWATDKDAIVQRGSLKHKSGRIKFVKYENAEFADLERGQLYKLTNALTATDRGENYLKLTENTTITEIDEMILKKKKAVIELSKTLGVNKEKIAEEIDSLLDNGSSIVGAKEKFQKDCIENTAERLDTILEPDKKSLKSRLVMAVKNNTQLSQAEQEIRTEHLDNHAEELASTLVIDKSEAKQELESLTQYDIPISEAKETIRKENTKTSDRNKKSPEKQNRNEKSPEKQNRNEKIESHVKELSPRLNADKKEIRKDLESLLEYSVPIGEAVQSVIHKHNTLQAGKNKNPANGDVESHQPISEKSVKSTQNNVNSESDAINAEAERIPATKVTGRAESPAPQSLNRKQLQFEDSIIGSGGQGIVRQAILSKPNLPDSVAVKEPVAGGKTLANDEIEAFFEQAKTWETINRREREKKRWEEQDHIVGIIDKGKKMPWIAMEYMDGGSLSKRIEKASEGLPIKKALWIGECICQGVEVAHSLGVAHLDLKPDNVLFKKTTEETWDVPKVSDWGLARVLAQQTGTMEGLSVHFAAPEQFEPDEFGDPDELTDIYQIGGIVYAMLTGDPPFAGNNLSVMRDVVSEKNPDPPSEVRPGLSQIDNKKILNALKTNKRDRYQSVVTFKQALNSLRTDL